MTNEQAISVLKSLISYYNDSNEDDCYVGFDNEDNEALNIAIKALEQISHLTDRLCPVCEFHTENGCSKWNCVFETGGGEDAE